MRMSNNDNTSTTKQKVAVECRKCADACLACADACDGEDEDAAKTATAVCVEACEVCKATGASFLRER